MAISLRSKILGAFFAATVAAPLLAITAVGLKAGHENPVDAHAVTTLCMQGGPDLKLSTRALLCLSVPGVKMGQALSAPSTSP